MAQRWIAQGHIRRNSQRVTRQDQAVEIGDVLTLPLGNSVKIIRILALPDRRGPPAEAKGCYDALDDGGCVAIAGAKAALSAAQEGHAHP